MRIPIYIALSRALFAGKEKPKSNVQVIVVGLFFSVCLFFSSAIAQADAKSTTFEPQDRDHKWKEENNIQNMELKLSICFLTILVRLKCHNPSRNLFFCIKATNTLS